MTTVTQSRLLGLARFHPATGPLWPVMTCELFHDHLSPCQGVSIFALRRGTGYAVAWIDHGSEGVAIIHGLESARAHAINQMADIRSRQAERERQRQLGVHLEWGTPNL